MSREKMIRIMTNAMLLSRSAMINQTLFDPKGRNLDAECGYPVGNMTGSFYNELYQSVAIANRIVGVFPGECWSIYPELYETDEDRSTAFEEKWGELNRDSMIWSFLDRIDELSGIGSFGVLFLGMADGGETYSRLPGVGDDGRAIKNGKFENELLFMRAFDESQVMIERFEIDFRNPRYGQPTMYNLKVVDPTTVRTDDDTNSVQHVNIRVHWSRIIHVADNRKTSEVFGLPRMKPVLPEIFDIRKIRGGSAEMFWRGAFPGYSFETNPELGLEVEVDKESIEDEFEKYANGLQRYLALTGVTAKSLAPQIAAPSNHLDEQYRSIGATLGVPLRILIGAESAHLASTQDTGTWNRRLSKRQEMYITPHIIKPFIDRMIMCGVLPTPTRYKVMWNDLNTMSAKDKADVALRKTQAMMTYVTGGVEQIMPLLEYYINVLGLTIGEATAILKSARRKSRKKFTIQGDPVAKAKLESKSNNNPGNGKPEPQGGGRNGGDNQNQPGSPGTAADGSMNT